MSRRTSAAVQPCGACGAETAAGSTSYSDRRQVDLSDGSRTYLCADCVAAIRAPKGGSRLTDDELRRQVERGSLTLIRWGGPFGH